MFTTLLPATSTETSLLTSARILRSVSPAFAWKIWMFPPVYKRAQVYCQVDWHKVNTILWMHESLEDSRGIRQTLWKTGRAFVRHPKFMTTLLPASSTETLLLTSACIWRSVSPAHACEGCMLRCGCSSSVQENASILPSRLTRSQHHSLDARVFGRPQGHSSVQTAWLWILIILTESQMPSYLSTQGRHESASSHWLDLVWGNISRLSQLVMEAINTGKEKGVCLCHDVQTTVVNAEPVCPILFTDHWASPNFLDTCCTANGILRADTLLGAASPVWISISTRSAVSLFLFLYAECLMVVTQNVSNSSVRRKMFGGRVLISTHDCMEKKPCWWGI